MSNLVEINVKHKMTSRDYEKLFNVFLLTLPPGINLETNGFNFKSEVSMNYIRPCEQEFSVHTSVKFGAPFLICEISIVGRVFSNTKLRFRTCKFV